MSLHLNYSLKGLKGADYNPRRIDDADLKVLQESIRTLGLCKPLIVRGNTLVAGHQRSKALQAMGVDRAPVFVLKEDTTTYDEVRFNQLHNGTDLDLGVERVKIEGLDELGYTTVKPEQISGNLRAPLAPVRNAIMQLISRYGSWGAVVATRSGSVVHCAQYALSCKIIAAPLTVYVIPDEEAERYQGYLNKTYGVFCYDNIQRETYIQTLAQMNRLNKSDKGRQFKSSLYERFVIPHMNKHPLSRGIDFGSGRGGYAQMLRGKGFALHDVELFRRSVGKSAIDMRAVHRMIDKMTAQLSRHGPYEFVVLDSVMNSVDCLEAQQAVLHFCNVLAKPGARFFLSGRKFDHFERLARDTKLADNTNYVNFPDEHGFTAAYRKGRWFFQKFHNEEEARDMLKAAGFKVLSVDFKTSGTSWQIVAEKADELTADQAKHCIDYEFELPVSDTRTIERSDQVWSAVSQRYEGQQ